MQNQKEIVAVTGATGVLGSRLTYDLLQKGYHVRALKRKTSSLKNIELLFKVWNPEEDLSSNMEWIDGDVMDNESLLKLAKGAKYFFHAAAVVSFDPGDRDLMMKINIEGTKNAIQAALEFKVKRFCHTSSIAALGKNNPEHQEETIDENSNFLPLSWSSAYSESKYLSEQEVWKAFQSGLKGVIVNPSIIIGVGADLRSSAKLFHLASMGFPFYSEGISGFVDVRDVSRAMIELTESSINGERFIINEGNHRFKEVFDLLAESLNRTKPFIKLNKFMFGLIWRFEKLRSIIFSTAPLITRETAKTATAKRFYSNEKIKKALKFEFIPLADSIRDHAKYYKVIREVLNR